MTEQPVADVLIRPAQTADIARLIALDSVAAHDPQRGEDIRRATEQGECWLLQRGGTVVAYAVLSYHFFHCGFIDLLMVDPAARQQGSGTQLLRALPALCRTAKLFTSVNRSNQGMQALLRREGFVFSGEVDNLDEGDPECFYCLRVK